MTRNRERRGSRVALVAIAATLAAGCAAAGRPTGTSSSAPTEAPTRQPTGSLTATRSPGASPTAPASVEASPPVAMLRADGASDTPGALGSYTIGSGGSDAPWLPGEPVTVDAGSQISIDLSGADVARWQARLGTAPDTDVRGLGEGTAPIVFAAPAAGRWALAVRVFIANGDASYYWAVTVR